MWKEVYNNKELTEFAATNLDDILLFSLKADKGDCVKRLLTLTVDQRSVKISKAKNVVASQILGKLLQIKKFKPNEVSSSAVCDSSLCPI